MTVCVTGGCGFIGANLVRHLLRHGYPVVVVDNLSTGRREYLDGLNTQIVVADVRDTSTWRSVLKPGDDIVHLAAHTRVPDSVANPLLDFDINVRGTFEVLTAARETGVRRVIFASSNAPLGRQQPPAREDKTPLPISPYGASKLAGEGYCLAFYGAYGVETVVLRFSNVYGPFASHKESVVAQFFNDAFHKRALTVHGDGRQTRDLIFVDDLVQGIRLALESARAAGEIIQLGTGVETTVMELASQVQAHLPYEIALIHKPPRVADIGRNYSDIRKARKLLDFNPRVPLEEGLRQTFAWFVEAYPEVRHG
jgi:UDP-glucose 4-epimerase